MAGYDVTMGEIRLWWSRTKRERPRCGARRRDGERCQAPPVWDRKHDKPVNGRCRMHGGLATGPRTEEGRRRIAESNRARSSSAQSRAGAVEAPQGKPTEKRGNREAVTQQGISG